MPLPESSLNKGIVLIAVKNPTYGRFAFNFVLSLKEKSPDLKVQLICDDEGIQGLTDWHFSFFDIITKIDREFSHHKDEFGRVHFMPASVKLGMYKLAAFEKNLYLDVDGTVVNPIDYYFDLTDKDFSTQVFDYCDSTAEEFGNMLWARPKQAWKHFKLPVDGKLPATNTSWIMFKKSKVAEEIFSTALNELLNNPLNREFHKMKWGSGQPDELYLNVSLCKLGYDASIPDVPYTIFFSNKRMNEDTLQKFPILGMYGPRGAIHKTTVDYCDSIIRNIYLNMGMSQEFKYSSMMRDKYQHKKY